MHNYVNEFIKKHLFMVLNMVKNDNMDIVKFQKEYCFKCGSFTEEYGNYNIKCMTCIKKRLYLNKEKINMKAVTIMSGGLDSTTLLSHIIKQGIYDKIYVLSFNYGQKHSKELEYAKASVLELNNRVKNITHKIIDITSIQDFISVGSLTGIEDVPHAMYDDESQKRTIVPNRNMIMLSIAAGYACKIGARHLYYGAHKSDYAIYPDCRLEFIKALDTAIHLGNINEGLELKAPFAQRTKDEIVMLGINMGTRLDLTWSCYEGGEKPCLKCGTCLERTEAFMKNNYQDPALSDHEWHKAREIYLKEKNGEKNGMTITTQEYNIVKG